MPFHDFQRTLGKKVFVMIGTSFFLGASWFTMEQFLMDMEVPLPFLSSNSFLNEKTRNRISTFRDTHITRQESAEFEQPTEQLVVRPTSVRNQHRKMQDLTNFETKGSTLAFYENFYASAAKSECKDSDGGINYAQRGEVVYESGDTKVKTILSDRVLGTHELLEYYCENGTLKAESMRCPIELKGPACALSSKEAMAKEFFYSADKEYSSTHILQLAPGWNWVSFALDPHTKVVKDLFQPLYEVDESFIIKEHTGDLFWPKMDIDLLGVIDPFTAYQIYVSRPLELEIPGSEFAYPIYQELKAGWNFFGFHSFEPAKVQCVLKDLIDSNQLWAVKDSKGKVMASVNGEWEDEIESFVPGQAYQVYVYNFEGETRQFEFRESFLCEENVLERTEE